MGKRFLSRTFYEFPLGIVVEEVKHASFDEAFTECRVAAEYNRAIMGAVTTCDPGYVPMDAHSTYVCRI